MKTRVEFKSTLFPAYPEEDRVVNPGQYGKRLAEWIKAGLLAHGIEALEIYHEDWGWAVPIRNPDFPLWIGCGNSEEYEDGFLCFIEPRTPTVRRFFSKFETAPAVSRVAEALDQLLTSEPEIHDIRWWTEEEAGV